MNFLSAFQPFLGSVGAQNQFGQQSPGFANLLMAFNAMREHMGSLGGGGQGWSGQGWGGQGWPGLGQDWSAQMPWAQPGGNAANGNALGAGNALSAFNLAAMPAMAGLSAPAMTPPETPTSGTTPAFGGAFGAIPGMSLPSMEMMRRFGV